MLFKRLKLKIDNYVMKIIHEEFSSLFFKNHITNIAQEEVKSYFVNEQKKKEIPPDEYAVESSRAFLKKVGTRKRSPIDYSDKG